LIEEGSKAKPGAVQREATRGQRFDLLVDQVVDYAIFLLDPQGQVSTWNPGAQRIKGYLAGEIIGKPYATFFTEEDRRSGKPERILRQASAEGRVQDEGWRLRKDGTRFWASVVMTALHDETGALTGFAKITRDLSERLVAEENARRLAAEQAARQQAELDQQELRRSRDQLNLILSSISEGVTVQTPDGRLLFANQTAAQLSGFDSAEEMIAAPLQAFRERFEMLREDGSPIRLEELPGRRAFGGQPARAMLRFRKKGGGEERWSFVSAAPVLTADGRVDMVVNVFRDFTERKQAESAWQFLAEASAVLGSSLDYEATLAQVVKLAVPEVADWCGVEMLGEDGTLQQLAVAHVNPAKLELAREWRRRYPPRPGSAVYQVLATGEPRLIPEIGEDLIAASTLDPELRGFVRELSLRSAMIAPLLVRKKALGAITFVTAESGHRYGPNDLILATEIARRAALAIENARAYSGAQAAIQIRDTFLSIASHELRTPLSTLTVIMSSLVRLAEQGKLLQLGPERLHDRLVKADRQAGQLGQLVDRLLDVTRLSSPEMRLELEDTDLAQLAAEVAARFDEEVERKGVSFTVSAEGPAFVPGDRARLDQVISNLVANALKYGGRTPVTLTVSRIGNRQVRLSVKDEGPGIPPEHQERIFSQFERAATPNVAGMGLGLWIVRRIVAAHGGTVTVESEPGKGARFTVCLPAKPRDEEPER
jgi:PAS domain S-box-containing protein